MKIRVLIISIAVSLFLALTTFGYFDLMSGAPRSSGMGNAVVAVDGDADAGLYNPAALAALTRGQFIIGYQPLMMGISTANLGIFHGAVALPISQNVGTIGLVFDSMSTKDLYNESQIQLAFGHEFRIDNFPMLAIGVALKLQNVSVNNYDNSKVKGSGVNGDIGIFSGFTPSFTMGIVAQNLFNADLGINKESILPMQINAGLAYRIPLVGTLDAFLIAGNVVVPVSGDSGVLTYHFGIEASVKQTVKIRAGYDYNGVTLGLGYDGADFGAGIATKIPFGTDVDMGVSLNIGINVNFSPPGTSWRERISSHGSSEDRSGTAQETSWGDSRDASTADIRARLENLIAERDEAINNGDYGRVGPLQEEIDALEAELAQRPAETGGADTTAALETRLKELENERDAAISDGDYSRIGPIQQEIDEIKNELEQRASEGADSARIRELETRLEALRAERGEAINNGEFDKVGRIQQEINEVENELELLR